MKKLRKRITAMLLVLAMAMSLLCTSVWAAETDEISEDSSAPVVVEEVEAEEAAPAAEEAAEVVVDELAPMNNAAEAEEASEPVLAEGLGEVPAEREAAAETLNQVASGIEGNLMWSVSDDGVLTISGTGAMNDYQYVEPAWYQYALSVTRINIESGVTSISTCAFMDFIQVTSVTIPSTVTLIYPWAFLNCVNLQSLAVPTSVVAMGAYSYGYYYADYANEQYVAQPSAAVIGAYGSGAQAYADDYNIAFTANGIVAPQNVTCSNTAKGVKISWSKIDGATGYTVYRGSKALKTVTGTSYTDTGAKSNGKKYTYQVVANTKINGKAKSSAKSMKSTHYYVSGVSCTKLANYSGRRILVYWKKNSKASGYFFRVSTSSKFANWDGKGYEVDKASRTSAYTSNSFKKGKTYYVQVCAYKKVGSSYYYSAWSATKKIKVK